MKKFYTPLLVLAVPALFLFLTSEMMYPTGSPGGKTGSPGDNGANCTGCHSGTPITQEFWIYSPELLTGPYQPNSTYSLIVLGISEDANKFGFEATAEDADGNKVGSFQAGVLGRTQTINNNKAVTHTALGNTPLADTGTYWMFSWTSPSALVGPVTFYAAINAANGNDAPTGDQINLTQFTAQAATGIFGRKSDSSLGLYPNPSSGIIRFNEELVNQAEKLEVIDLNGQVVYVRQLQGISHTLDLGDLKKGIYIVRAGEKSQRLILH